MTWINALPQICWKHITLIQWARSRSLLHQHKAGVFLLMTTESDIQLWSWSENCPELEPTKQLRTQLTKWGQDTVLGSLLLVAGFLCHIASNKTEDLVPSIFFYWMSTKNCHFLLITLVLGVIIFSLVFFISRMDRWSEKWTKWHRIYQNPSALASSNWSCKSERIASLSHSTSVTLLVRRSSSDSPVFLISQGDLMFRWIEHFKLLSLRVTQALSKALFPLHQNIDDYQIYLLGGASKCNF